MISKSWRPLAERAAPGIWYADRAQRFAVCFPRVYAFTLAITDDQTLSRDLATTAFAEAFVLGATTEQEFVVELFRQARELARRSASPLSRGPKALNAREREIISLSFDAELSRDQISLVLGVPPEVVGGELLNGLRKLQASTRSTSGALRPAAA